MNKLKTLFVSNSGIYIHVGIFVVLSMISYYHLFAFFLWIVDALYLFRFHSFFLWLGLGLSLIIGIRYGYYYNLEPTNIDTNQSLLIVDVHETQLTVKQHNKKYYLYTQGNEPLIPGDVVTVDGSMIENEGYIIQHAFDYHKYLKSQRIEGLFYADSMIKQSHQFHINQIKTTIKAYLASTYDDQTCAYISLFMLGEDDGLSDSTKSAIQRLNISHLFAVSGMHVGIIVIIIERLLSKFHLMQRTKQIIIVIFLLIYSFLCGFTPSIIRASLLIFFMYVNQHWHLPFSKLDWLSFLLIGFLIINPFMIHYLGFQLSFLVTIVILLGQSIFKDGNNLVSICKLTTVAFLFSLPILLEVNGGFHLLCIPIGILFTLLVTKIMMPAMMIMIFLPMFQSLFCYVISGFEWLIIAFSSNQFFVTFNFVNEASKIMYWISIYYFMFLPQSMKSRLTAFMSLLAAFFLSTNLVIVNHYASVSVLDVGNGDAIHLQSRNEHCLIDTGSDDDMNRIINYFKKNNIKKLKTVFITHRHEDHLGELDDLLNEMTIVNYVGHPFELIDDSVRAIIPNQNDWFTCGDITIQVMHFDLNNENENNNSLVLLANVYNQTWLFTGDIESEVENQLVDLTINSIDFLKVPHHGSSTSSTPQFVKKMNPKTAIISVGKHNSYGHPANEVISRYQAINSRIYRTDQSGSITFHFYQSKPSPYITEEAEKRCPFGYLKFVVGFWVWLFELA